MKMSHVLFFVIVLQGVSLIGSDVPGSSTPPEVLDQEKRNDQAALCVQNAWNQLIRTADNFDISNDILQNDIEVCRKAVANYKQVTGQLVSETVPNLCSQTIAIFKLLEAQKTL